MAVMQNLYWIWMFSSFVSSFTAMKICIIICLTIFATNSLIQIKQF